MSDKALLEARVSPAELEAALVVVANGIHEHVTEGLARGQLERLLSGLRCLDHFERLAGPTMAAKVWRQVCGVKHDMRE